MKPSKDMELRALKRSRGRLKAAPALGAWLVRFIVAGLFSLMALPARAQTTNSTQEILRMQTFREGLVWIGEREPGEAENQELLEVLKHLNESWWPTGVEQFLRDHPDSPWAASLRHDYACFCRRTGRTTKALDQWAAAWAQAKDVPGRPAQQLAGSILASWMDLLASLGRLDELKTLIAAGDQWHFFNPRDRDKFQGAKRACYLMQSHPGIAYRCGTFALKAVGQKLQPANHALDELAAMPSPTNGFSMATLLDLAGKHGLNLIAARRSPGQPLIVPCVVHWRQNHYAAILEQKGDHYLVNDPTFGRPKWMSGEVIDEEASGEFLVPAAGLTNGWTQLARDEIKVVHGMGLPNNINDGRDKGCTPTGACPHCQGMPVWWVTEPYVNLWIADEPVSYMTSRGEPFTFRVSYKQRDSRPEPNDYYVATAGWNNSWASYVKLDSDTECNNEHGNGCMPALATCYATVYLANGGEVDFSPGQSFDSETRLTLRQQNPDIVMFNGRDYGDNGLRLVYPDGSEDIYGVGITLPVPFDDDSQAEFLLSRHIDKYGDTTWFEYDAFDLSHFVVTFVIDPDGRTNTLSYTANDLLSSVTNAYGLSAHFKYDANGNLTNLVDAQGMSSSITYDTNGYPTALITPYGTNQFSLTDNGAAYADGTLGNAGGDNSNNLIDRSALVVDPVGATNLYLYRYDSATVLPATNFSNVPAGTPLGTLDSGTEASDDGLNAVYFRNSYHWGPRQFANVSTPNFSNFVASDYLLGRTQHWLQDTNDLYVSETLSVARDPSPSRAGTTEGLKTFYDYQGKTYNYREGASALPSVIAWCLPGGETHYEYLLYDYFGNVTNDITTYTLPGGGVGARTNQFVYANNTYTAVIGTWNGSGIYNTASSSFTIPNLLTRVIGPDGNTIWAYGGFDTVTWTNFFVNSETLQTNGALLISSRVLPDYATNGLGQVATTTFTAGQSPVSWHELWPGTLAESNTEYGQYLGTTWPGYSKVASHTSAAGLTTTNIYNGSGFLAQTIDVQIGRTNSFSYTTNGLPGTFTNELGLNLAATWDNLLRLTRAQFPDGTYISNAYNKLDLSGVRDRLGNWTSYSHDGARRLTSVTDANSHVTTFDWCGCGALTAIIDPYDNPTYFYYDNQGNLTNEVFPDGSALFYQYDLAARRTLAFDGVGRAVNFDYNHQSLVTAVSNSIGTLGAATFDLRDRPVTITDANGITVTNTFDLLDRLLSSTWPDGHGEGYGYSPQGLASYTNRDGQVTGYGRDAAGRETSVTNANHEVIQKAYNPADELTSLTDGLNHTTLWQFNQYGWMTNKIDGRGSNVFQYACNADGWVTNRWTPQHGNAGYTYDSVGNLTGIAYPSSSISYAYDAVNRLTNLVDAIGTTTRTYTPVGRLQSESGPWANATVTNTYQQGLRTAMSILQAGGAWSQTYAYDAMWRMTTNTSPAGAFAYGYGFAPASPLVTSIALPNAASIINSYNGLAQLTSTALINYWGHTLDATTYSPDPLGLRTNLVRNLGLTTNSVAVGYDNIGQIISWLAQEASGTPRLNEQLGLAYDAAGNLLSRTNGALIQTFNVDAANELTSVNRSGTFTLSGATPAPATSVTVNGQPAQTNGDFTFARTNLTLLNGNNTFTNIAQNVYGLKATNTFTVSLPASVTLLFDLNGNLTNDGARTFAYDAENQLTNITLPGYWKSDFVYDGLNRRRVARDFTWTNSAWLLTNEVHYLYDGLLPVQERDTNGNPTVTYTRGLDFSGSISGAGGIGGLLARTDTNGSTYYHADGAGNITALMDGDQNIVARYLYNPFGKLLGQWGTMANANAMQFSSMPARRGIVLYPFRGYEPNFQRWLNRDPISELGGINVYRMVANAQLIITIRLACFSARAGMPRPTRAV